MARPKKQPRPRYIAFVLAILVLSGLGAGCSASAWQADLPDFVETGLSMVYLSSSSYVGAGLAVNEDVSYGNSVTVTGRIYNAKRLDLSYTLACDPTLIADGTLPTIPDSPAGSTGYTVISFSFVPSEAAEHGDIVFTLGIVSPSINREYVDGTITVHCDSPPAPVENLTAGIRKDKTSCIGFNLPEGNANSDIVSIEVSYVNGNSGLSRTLPLDVSPTGTELTTVSDPPLLDSDAGQYIRYFLPDDVIAKNPYSYTVVCIDAAGKRSAVSAQVSVTGDETTLLYDPNGGEGTVGAKFGYNGTSYVSVSAAKSLSLAHKYFVSWNTAADASGVTYLPGDVYAFTEEDVTLYAQWQPLGLVGISLSDPAYASLTFSPSSVSVQRGASVTVSTESGTLASSGSGWSWAIDGASIASATGSSVALDTSGLSIGQHTLSCSVTYEGIVYSGSLALTVTKPYSVSYVGNGNTAGSAPSAQECLAGSSLALTRVDASFVKSGYAFAGWATSASAASATYADGATCGPINADLVLYAVWANLAPASVSNLVAVPGDQKVSLSWVDPADADVAYVRVDYSGGATGSLQVGKGAQGCVIKGLPNGAACAFTVTVYDSGGLASTPATIASSPAYVGARRPGAVQ